MAACVERGMSAPPEVVFNTATDPARVAAWLPSPLRVNGNRLATVARHLRACWVAPQEAETPETAGWSAELAVRQVSAGGAMVRLELAADLPDQRLVEIANDSLNRLARHVADNLTAG